MADKDSINIDGFVFSDPNAVEIAKKEQSAVEYLKAQVDFKRPEAVLSVYQKLVHQKVFHTVIGLSFLKGLQDKLLAERQVPNTLVDPIDADPMMIKSAEPATEASSKSKKEKLSANQKKYKERFIATLVVCIILLITVAVMFVLALTSNSPNILNYRTQIENEYATWQQDLDKREKEVTKRENQLLEGATQYQQEESDNSSTQYNSNADEQDDIQLQQNYDNGDMTDDGSDTYR